ncbi:MAG: redox-sensing transcriptional repressor Rex [Clostridia bacterium]|nr:redox-sensing transcriptional repressor Rex [Clostridia bacterium]
MERTSVPKATLGRLPKYLSLLRELPPGSGRYISSTAIAKHLDLGEVQVRKDLSAVSGTGKPKLGYLVADLIGNIERLLGCNNVTSAVLVGAGRLGRALLEFEQLEEYGVEIAAAFDCNDKPIKLGNSKEILPMSGFDDFCRKKNIQIGIITVGEGSAQEVCRRMTDCGITAIWNFAPCKLEVPEGILLKNENLALSLAYLRNQICN